MKVTKRFYFSASHRYYKKDWSESKNREAFGKCVNYHGHNYVLDVTVEGEIDNETGMVINLSDLKEIVQEVLEEFDHKNLNEDLPYFKDLIPTTENIAIVLWDLIFRKLPNNVNLVEVRLFETDDLFVIYKGEDKDNVQRPILGRRYRFSVSHRLHNPDLTEEENQRLYGKCNNPKGHGHNYYLEVTVQTKVNEIGMVTELSGLDKSVACVIDELDYKWLDKDIDFFKEIPSTTENLLVYLKDRLADLIPNMRSIRLEETRNNFFEMEV